jgi:ATP-dependent Clp protease protease subunit
MARKDDAELYLDHGIHLGLGYLYLGNEGEEAIEAAWAERATKGIQLLCAAGKDPTIWLNSDGGDVNHGLAAHDVIAAAPRQVTAVGLGSVMSMAVVVLQAADVRLLAPNARVMVHVGSASAEGHLEDVQRYAKELKAMDRLCEDILLAKIRQKHPKYTRAKLQRLCAFDSYLSAEAAVALGLADGIWSKG